jgi:hypothetical protein
MLPLQVIKECKAQLILHCENQCSESESGSTCFGPPGSGSFRNQAKIVRKTLILVPGTVLFCAFFGLFIFENDLNEPSKVISRKTCFKLVFCWRLLGQ